MPDLKIHEEESLKTYGKSFTELHQWMDDSSKVFHCNHRKYRHDPQTTPLEAKKLFGENADHVCLDHIILDLKETQIKLSYSTKKLSGKSIILSIRVPNELHQRLIELSLFLDKTKSTIVNDMIKKEMIDLIDMTYWIKFEENLREETKEFFYGKPKSIRETPSLIFKRDKGKCRKCGSMEDIIIYHIDGNIGNFQPINNILLCNNCLKKFQKFMMKYANKSRFAAWLSLNGN